MSDRAKQAADWREALRSGHVYLLSKDRIAWMALLAFALMAPGCTRMMETGLLRLPLEYWGLLGLAAVNLIQFLTSLRRWEKRAVVTHSDLWISRYWRRPWRVPWERVVRVVREERARGSGGAGLLAVHVDGRRRPLVLGPPLSGEQLDDLYLELLGHTNLQAVPQPPPEPRPGDPWVEDIRREVWARPR